MALFAVAHPGQNREVEAEAAIDDEFGERAGQQGRRGRVCGASEAGTSAASADERPGWRIANAVADNAPAEPPTTGTLSMPSQSSRSTKASAWFSDDGSSGKAERR